MVMGSLPITVPPKEPEEAPSPPSGFLFFWLRLPWHDCPLCLPKTSSATSLDFTCKGSIGGGDERDRLLCSEHAPRPVSFRACGGASAQLWHPDQEVNSWIPPTTGLPRTPATNPAPTRRDCPRGQRSRLPRRAPVLCVPKTYTRT